MLFGTWCPPLQSSIHHKLYIIIKPNDNICSPHLCDHYQPLYYILLYITELSSPGSGIYPWSQTKFYQALFLLPTSNTSKTPVINNLARAPGPPS